MNWFTRLLSRLFPSKDTLIGTRMHAWHYTPYGRARIEGEVVDETEQSLYLDISNPTAQEWYGWKRVWRHDARPLDEELPVDLTDLNGEMGT